MVRLHPTPDERVRNASIELIDESIAGDGQTAESHHLDSCQWAIAAAYGPPPA